jgi:hypothetical protein
LSDEINIIATHWQNYIIMIDDFSVPYDKDYGFDDYGPNKALNYELIRHLLAKYKIKTFFPTLPASQETGAKRGCALLASEGKMSLLLSGLSLLKSYTSEPQ